MKGARKFKSMGQRDDAALAAMATAVDFHSTIGSARVEARLAEFARSLKAGLMDAGAALVTPVDATLSAGVCVVRLPAAKRQEVYRKLYEEHGIAGAPTGGLRLCPHVYNTLEHVERAIRGFKACVAG